MSGDHVESRSEVAGSVRTTKILVVDDEQDMRDMVSRILRDLQFQILEAEDGTSALDLALKHRPDLIISDVMMDCGSGFMLDELLQQDATTAAIPLILMSGRAIGAGAWESDPRLGYLEKPFSAAELISAILQKLGPKLRGKRKA